MYQSSGLAILALIVLFYLAFLFIYVWVRGTLPRLRYDQLMGIGWKVLLPASLANVVLTSLMILVTHR